MKKLCLAVALVAACAAPVVGPPPEAPFDPAKSEPKALELLGQMQAALSSKDFASVKQLQWQVMHYVDNQPKLMMAHAWDRVSHRHRAEMQDAVAMYYLYDHSRGTATYGGSPVGSGDRGKIIEQAFGMWKEYGTALAGLYLVKASGAILKHRGLMEKTPIATGATICDPNCETIHISYDSAARPGEEIWIHINSTSKLPELLEHKAAQGRLSYAVTKWVDVDGYKFPAVLQNAGVAGEHIDFGEIKIGSPDEELYVPVVR